MINTFFKGVKLTNKFIINNISLQIVFSSKECKKVNKIISERGLNVVLCCQKKILVQMEIPIRMLIIFS